ncbi:MAG TPA: DUF5054 domain-containing protein [Candidatus Acidoferrales bacterium]|nr:DUF5054 domain-containing protein [Candidatus Acidoferrales bacterium]
MERRNFLGNLLAAGAFRMLTPDAAPAFQASASGAPDPEVKRVLVMFKCHLDVGFVDTQANIIRKYFEQYFPRAIQTAATLRSQGADRYVWTTGSWLIYQYLEKHSGVERQRMEQAIRDGDIAWHALPFTWQTELMDRTLIAGGLELSRSLDRRFQRTTTGAKMTDVPGHTRGIIGPLAERGVKLLDIGVNSASTPPDVPPLFLWKDANGNSLVMMYHRHSYGDVVKIPGANLAVDVEVRDDNAGPHTLDEIRGIYAGLRKQFPKAEVKAANLTDIATAIEPHRSRLPVVTQEIGDTWIYGVPSDPMKVARYLEAARLRSRWIADGKLKTGDPADLAFLSNFLLEVEHTWGTDTKTWLDFDHYTPNDLRPMLDQPKYKVVQSSWAEKRQDLFDAMAALPAPLRSEATDRLRDLQPREPDISGLKPHAAGEPIDAKHFVVALDPKTGAISRLRSRKSGHEWASARQPLGAFSYQTLSKADYDRFFAAYLKSKADWAPKDFGKPNIERFGAQSRVWSPSIGDCRAGLTAAGQRIVARLQIDDSEAAKTGRTAWPQKMYLELTLPDAEPTIEIRFSWFGKAANRMPEGLWLSFLPNASDPRGWILNKSGSAVSPFDVVTGGNRAMHAVLGGLGYSGPEGTLKIESLDAPVVALGERLPVYFSRNQPDPAKGFHFSLFNNGWGTNYIQWFGEDMSFRFKISA